MRVRTAERRQAIIKAAGKVFAEEGFEGASMAAISERVGGSKATLYGYFPSKEDLFVAVIQQAATQEAAKVDELLAGPLREGLERFGLWRLRTTLTPAGLSVRRMVWADSTMRKRLFEIVPADSTWGRVAARFQLAIKHGELRNADPWTAAQHFRGLLETDITDRAFFGFPTGIDEALLRRTVKDSVETFFRAYAAERKSR